MSNTEGIVINAATETADFEGAKRLFIAYQQFLGEDLCFQGFNEELQQIPSMYAPPNGYLLLAKKGTDFVGCVAFRFKATGICEMKRLYVRDDFKQAGLGRLLVEKIIAVAKKEGYKKMILDTLERLSPALRLYQSIGFKKISPYYSNPLKGVVFMELILK
ncbi:MAG: GNAT family N-acetyltransferase [Bacteroidota bacterium]